VPYLSASVVVIHYEEALYQVYVPLPSRNNYGRVCVSVDPTAQLEWTKLDDELSRDIVEDDGTLIIPSVTMEHQGTYRCTTTTIAGTSHIQFILTVEGRLLTSVNWIVIIIIIIIIMSR